MKKIIITLLLAIICQNLLSAKEIVLQYTHKVGSQNMEIGTGVYTNAAGTQYKITRADFYMSVIKLIHDGEQTTELGIYELVKGGQTTLNLGNYEVDNLEALQFSLGIDPETNHTDPSSYPADSPLANQNPSMHWGWSAGYRFMAIEGVAADANGEFTVPFEIHTAFDENLLRVLVPTAGTTNGDVLTINVTVDYAELLKNIDMTTEIYSHAMGNAFEQMLVNISHNPIFTATIATNVLDNTLIGKVLFANPLTQTSTVNYLFPNTQNLSANLTDLSGKTVAQYQALPNNGTLQLPNSLINGMYILQFNDEKQQISSKYKIQVLR